jgi:hypothetical protein
VVLRSDETTGVPRSTMGDRRVVDGAGGEGRTGTEAGVSKDDVGREEEVEVTHCSVVARKKSVSHP